MLHLSQTPRMQIFWNSSDKSFLTPVGHCFKIHWKFLSPSEDLSWKRKTVNNEIEDINPKVSWDISLEWEEENTNFPQSRSILAITTASVFNVKSLGLDFEVFIFSTALYRESIKRDAEEWDASGMWPYSCYRPNRAQGDVPGKAVTAVESSPCALLS